IGGTVGAGCTLKGNFRFAIGGSMWRVLIALAIFVGVEAKAQAEGVADPRLSTFRTLYQGAGVTPPSSKEDWRKRAHYLREQVLVAAGLWPLPPKVDLKAVVHGKIDRGD